ncbi:acyl-CoA dehydrogenase family protein [Actinokineospora spheciospongiae]|uniref:acyl-CoA dehydrogenase family protein n=1 Tax=Actinokineospora spheciospongiae TaxID=909613 RepID=UPI000D71D0F9|nr:acyl-CoA dehydrogenase family protein [Actinokineospora spheciospongiae]PWW53038.1 alkylation response protein AidB-like acyl-CoA dehydrogenase [Actinokineospora spheciospongiae]
MTATMERPEQAEATPEPMTAEARAAHWAKLTASAVELAAVFEQRSLEDYDKGTFVQRNIDDLVAAGITAVNVPADLGGFDATLAENVELLRLIAKGCGSTAFTFAIHTIITGSLRGETSPEVKARVFDAVKTGAFVIGPFTDESSGSNWTVPSTVAKRVDDGFVLQGVKHFATGYPGATHLLITAGLTDEHLRPPFNLAAFLVEAGAPGLGVHREWDGMAMPMTGSHSLAIDSLHVDGDDMLFPEGLTPLFVMSRQQWGHYCFAAVFLGLAERAYEIAIERTKGRSNTAVSSLATLPGIQFNIGRMRASIATMKALLTRHATEHVEPGEDLIAFVAETCVPKYFVVNEAEHVVATAFEVVGGSGISGGTRIGQIWRDVKAGPLVPFTNDVAREFIGKHELGLNPIETPRWL